jgi:hypothetical protein
LSRLVAYSQISGSVLAEAKTLRNFLIAISGAQHEILARCPTERTRFETLGLTILITSGIAAVSMWFALDSIVNLNPLVAFLIAVVWGLIILTIDRWVVTALPVGRSRKWSVIIPRVLMAVLVGIIISTPIVLRIFQPEINRQIAVIKQVQSNQFIEQVQDSAIGRQVASLRSEVASIQTIIAADGLVPTNLAADPVLQELNRELNNQQALEDQYYRQWQCELYGGSGCLTGATGSGVLAQAAEQSYRQAASQVSTLTSEIQARQKQLQANDQAASSAQLHQANQELPIVERQLAAAENNLSALETNFAAVNNSSGGLLLRLQALSQLSSQLTVSLARWLVFLLFVVIGSLPVAVKLIQHDGTYEEILEAAAERELRDARRDFRSLSRSPAPAARAYPPVDEHGLVEISPPTDSRAIDDYAVAQIWGHTRSLPSWARPEWMSRPITELLEPAETAPRPGDEALRDLEDLRAVPDTSDEFTELRADTTD